MFFLRRPRKTGLLGFVLAALALALGAAALAPSDARAADGGKHLTAHGNCVEGTYTVPHGVTHIEVDMAGAPGEAGAGNAKYDNYGNFLLLQHRRRRRLRLSCAGDHPGHGGNEAVHRSSLVGRSELAPGCDRPQR